jgi:hypothetical protein
MTDQVMFGGRSRAQCGFPAASVRRTLVAVLAARGIEAAAYLG